MRGPYIDQIAEVVCAEAERIGIKVRLVALHPLHPTLDLVFSIHVDGWSPTLHRSEEVEEQDLLAIAEDIHPWSDDAAAAAGIAAIQAGDVALGAAVLLNYLQPQFDEQLARAEAARRLGIDSPIEDLSEISHILLDEWVRDELRLRGHDPRRIVLEAIATLHGGANPSSNLAYGEDGTAFEVATELLASADGTPLPMVLVSIPAQGSITFDGHSLEVPGVELPDTVMDALPGRKLGNIVEAIPVLTGRPVERVEAWVAVSNPNASLGKTMATGLPLAPQTPVLKIWVWPTPVAVG